MSSPIALYLGILQLCFALTWTVYVIFLPSLLEQSGLGRGWVLTILLLDQLVFALSDWAVGTASDRVASTLGKLGQAAALATLLSCGAFLVMPHVAGAGAFALIAAMLVWTITSSALRAPPYVLIGKYVPPPRQPWFSAMSLFGLGLAGAVGPYLAILLKGADPRIPFAVSSVVLALVVAALSRAERTLAAEANAMSIDSPPVAAAKPIPAMFLMAALLAALGFQVHFSLNAAPQFLKAASPGDLPYLMPVFWIGFNLMILPASLWAARSGGMTVMAAGAMAGAVASAAIALGVGFHALVALQLIAGAAWGALLMSAYSAAMTAGRTGAEGRVIGAMFSLFALAALLRIGIVSTQANVMPDVKFVLEWTPAALWTLAAFLLWRSMPPQTGASSLER
jgi:hypothetical protein